MTVAEPNRKRRKSTKKGAAARPARAKGRRPEEEAEASAVLDPEIETDQEAEQIEVESTDSEEIIDIEPEEIELGEDDADADGEDDEDISSVAVVPTVPTAERIPSTVDPLASYLQQIRAIPEIDPEEQKRLARRYRETGDPEAAQLLITANLRLVVKLALMYRRALRNVMDLIQEGTIGLMEALKRYDPDQGVRFTTYAAWWIKAYMLKFLLDNARLVRVGTTNARRKLLYNLRKEQRKLQSQGVEVTPKLLASHFGVAEQDVVDVDRALSSSDVSVDTPLGEDSSTTVGDMLVAEDESIEERVATAEMRERVNRALAELRPQLEPRDRSILDQRLFAEDPVTLQELGKRYGVTREAVRQAEAKLKKRVAEFLRQRLGEDIVLRFTSAGDGSGK